MESIHSSYFHYSEELIPFDEIITALKNNTLTELDFEKIQSNPTLDSYFEESGWDYPQLVVRSSIGDTELTQLISALKGNTSLQKIDFSTQYSTKVTWTPEGIKAFADALKNHRPDPIIRMLLILILFSRS